VKVYTSTDAVPADLGVTAVAIGKFDGVHVGHRALLARLRDVARDRGLAPVAVTFDRNPLSLLKPEVAPVPLVSNEQKLELLAAEGMSATLMLAFDAAFSAQSPAEFVDRVLVDALHAREVLVGSDFRFGAHGAGTVDSLAVFGRSRGFAVELVDDVESSAAGSSSRRASSTWIRELMDAGDVRDAAGLLGRHPRIRSLVVHGAHRGRELGYPTANLAPTAMEGFIPADGVYAAWLSVDGRRLPAAVSVGNNPTFEGVPEKQVEAHVLDETLDLYDRRVELEFVERIRPMMRFADVDALIDRMADDEARVRAVLGLDPA
jgi:riboflavin kinase/FMN adenylyltransferase